MKALAVIVGTFVLEDLTTVLTALAAQQNKISILLAIISLWIGIMIGDILLYTLGMAGTKREKLHRFLKLSEVNRGQKWFSQNIIKIVIISRFVPGLRLPFYTACGFFRTPFKPFIQIVALSTFIWTIFLFFISFKAGGWILEHAEKWRWIGICGFFLGLYLLKKLMNRLRVL
ncbi:hypothetical protein FAI41_00355 [Acetobacteraceae bacterium]|nr:hypothetical protein FAI41_00355 [Acetobacteraceae bacterium]